VKDIGYHLTERMQRSLANLNATKDISKNESSPPIISFPGTDQPNLYKDINADRGVFYLGEGEELNIELVDRGDPRSRSTVNYNAPGLAMGESMILNPDFQFNELDDVRSDFRRPYIGRLYSERIYDYNLPKLIIRPGLATFNLGLFGVLGQLAGTNGEVASLSDYLRDPAGGFDFIRFTFQKIGAAIRGILNFSVGGLLAKKRYYNFKATPRVYMRFVNEMLIEIAAWMDLAKSPVADTEDWPDDGVATADLALADESAETQEEQKLNKPLTNEQNGEMDDVYGLPQSGTYAGYSKTLSVLNILPGWKSARNDSPPNKGFFKGIKDFFYETVNMSAQQFIPFGLSRGINVQETFTNSLEEHPLAADLKAKGREAYQKSLTGIIDQTGKAAEFAADILSSGKSIEEIVAKAAGTLVSAGVSAAVKGAAKTGKLGELGIVLTGEGRFQLPNIWQDSSFSRTNSLEFEFRSPYGNRLSIFENTMVPSIFLIALSAARQTGSSTYTSPFYINAFAKGLFSVELGMITNLSITREEGKNDKTQEGFSRFVKCSVEIRDALPNMMLSLDAGVFGILSSKNIGFREYIATVANIDLIDRTAFLNKYKVFMAALVNKISGEDLLNELKYGISQTLPFQLILKARTNFFGERPSQTVSGIQKPSSFS
jgi:hypothetical protein